MSSITTLRPLRALPSASSCLKICSPEALLTCWLFALNCQLSASNAELKEDRPHCCWCSPEKPRSLWLTTNPARGSLDVCPAPHPGVISVSSFYALTCPGALLTPQAAANSQGHHYGSGGQTPLPMCLWNPAGCCWNHPSPQSPLLPLWTHFSASVLLAPCGSYLLETFLRELLAKPDTESLKSQS